MMRLDNASIGSPGHAAGFCVQARDLSGIPSFKNQSTSGDEIINHKRCSRARRGTVYIFRSENSMSMLIWIVHLGRKSGYLA